MYTYLYAYACTYFVLFKKYKYTDKQQSTNLKSYALEHLYMLVYCK